MARQNIGRIPHARGASPLGEMCHKNMRTKIREDNTLSIFQQNNHFRGHFHNQAWDAPMMPQMGFGGMNPFDLFMQQFRSFLDALKPADTSNNETPPSDDGKGGDDGNNNGVKDEGIKPFNLEFNFTEPEIDEELELTDTVTEDTQPEPKTVIPDITMLDLLEIDDTEPEIDDNLELSDAKDDLGIGDPLKILKPKTEPLKNKNDILPDKININTPELEQIKPEPIKIEEEEIEPSQNKNTEFIRHENDGINNSNFKKTINKTNINNNVKVNVTHNTITWVDNVEDMKQQLLKIHPEYETNIDTYIDKIYRNEILNANNNGEILTDIGNKISRALANDLRSKRIAQSFDNTIEFKDNNPEYKLCSINSTDIKNIYNEYINGLNITGTDKDAAYNFLHYLLTSDNPQVKSFGMKIDDLDSWTKEKYLEFINNRNPGENLASAL